MEMEVQGVDFQIDGRHVVQVDGDSAAGDHNFHVVILDRKFQVAGLGHHIIPERFRGGSLSGRSVDDHLTNIVLKFIVVEVDRKRLCDEENQCRKNASCLLPQL